jgi:LemA protein
MDEGLKTEREKRKSLPVYAGFMSFKASKTARWAMAMFRMEASTLATRHSIGGNRMSIVTMIILGAVIAALIYAVMLYNGLVQVKHAVAKAWSNIDVLLKQRHDELPKLVETCKQYKQFEQETLQRVIEARSSVHNAREAQDIPALGQAEGALRMGLGRLFAVAEAYPELKANENFLLLQSRISALENGIADRRELYNDAVNINNVRIEQFPDVIFARMFNFSIRPLLEFTQEEKADVDMKALFS